MEGNSIRATARTMNVSKPTILRLLADLGTACARYQAQPTRRVQVHEIWQFVYAKAKNVPAEKRGTFGSATCGRGSRSMPTPS